MVLENEDGATTVCVSVAVEDAPQELATVTRIDIAVHAGGSAKPGPYMCVVVALAEVKSGVPSPKSQVYDEIVSVPPAVEAAASKKMVLPSRIPPPAHNPLILNAADGASHVGGAGGAGGGAAPATVTTTSFVQEVWVPVTDSVVNKVTV